MAKRPNIILITVDALRADYLGFLGYQKEISPNLDKFAKECATFTSAFTTGSHTPYSFPAILTSTYPLDYQGPFRLERPRMMISEVLKEEGFQTAAFQSGPYLSSYFGYNQGWDVFEEIAYPLPEGVGEKREGVIFSLRRFLINLFAKLTLNSFPHLFFWALYLSYRITKKRTSKITASFMNQIVKDFIHSIQEKKEPIFMWIHYMDVHGPFLPYDWYFQERTLSYQEFMSKELPGFILDYYPSSNIIFKKFSNKYLKNSIDLYEQGIKYVDEKIGELLEFLKKENIYQNSIICLTADHGTEFLEHNGAEHNMGKLYNELLHVPLLIKIPGKQNQIIDKKISLIDLAPTLCDLAGVKTSPFFKGKNLFSQKNGLIFHQAGQAKREDVWNIEIEKLSQCKVACQSDTWKYILDYGTRAEEIYNLSRDQKEQNNLSKVKPEILSQMRKKIKEFEEKNPPLPLV